MPIDIGNTSEPHDRLTRIGADMLKTLDEHPENADKRTTAVIILDDTEPHTEQSFDQPHNDLTRIADDMIKVLEGHPDNLGDRLQAVVIIDDPKTDRGGSGMYGYDDEKPAVARLVRHAKAIAQVNGVELALITSDEI